MKLTHSKIRIAVEDRHKRAREKFLTLKIKKFLTELHGKGVFILFSPGGKLPYFDLPISAYHNGEERAELIKKVTDFLKSVGLEYRMDSRHLVKLTNLNERDAYKIWQEIPEDFRAAPTY